MLVVDVLIVLALVAAIVVGGAAFVTKGSRRSSQVQTLGSRELARTMRLLDQIRAVDDAIPQLPAPLRSEVDRTIADYYREIEK